MTERDQYQQALTHARNGDLQAARKLLLKIDHPKAKALLVKVDAAIAKQPKKKRNPVAIGLIVLLVVVAGIAAALYIYGAFFYTGDEAAEQIGRRFAVQRVCHRVFLQESIDLEIDSEAFVAACRLETDYVMSVFIDEIAYCVEQSDEGRNEAQMIQCMADNDVSFLGTHVRSANEPERLSVPGRGD